jgi:hypothetical protein
MVVGGADNKEIEATSSDGGQTWTANWDGTSPGNYWVHAVAVAGGTSYYSNWISITVE